MSTTFHVHDIVKINPTIRQHHGFEVYSWVLTDDKGYQTEVCVYHDRANELEIMPTITRDPNK